tara:strand:+ start:156 stop:689 length:534 start_codon:yes stop_codon:yes gene_type:complete
MDIEIYAICCSLDLKKTACFSSNSAPYLSDQEGKNLINKAITDTSDINLCTHNAIDLPSVYKGNSISLSAQNTFHLFSYHDLRDTANIRGCYVIIGSENIQTLQPMEKYLLSQNILMKDRNLSDIINAPNKYTNKIIFTTKEEVKHVNQHSNGKKAPTEPLGLPMPPFNSCNLCNIF